MIPLNPPSKKPPLNDYVLVACPTFSPSGFEICETDMQGNFISQGNGMEINKYVTGWISVDEFDEEP